MLKHLFLMCNSGVNTSHSIGGGDVILIESYKRIRNNFRSVDSYCSEKIKILLEPHIKASYIISPRVFDSFPLIISYLLRTFSGTYYLLFLHKKQIDFIYASSDFFPDVIPSFLYTFFHKDVRWIQCIFHLYPDWRNRQGSRMKNFIMYYLQRFSFFIIKQRADSIIILNELAGQELEQQGFQKEKQHILPGGIDMKFISSINPDQTTKSYDATFLGRLHETKGVFDLIEIWKNVTKVNPNMTLAIIGNGDPTTVQKLKELVQIYGLQNNISMLGFLTKKEALQIIKKSKMFLFPSHEEGFGIAITEALACHVPVIAWNLPVYNTLFKNCLFTVQENDMSGFASLIIRVHSDGNIKTKNILYAVHYIKKYDWNKIALDHLQLYL